MSVTIRGRIIQKIPPKRLQWYVEPWFGFIPGKWHVTIVKPGVPFGSLRRFIYANFTHRKKAREEGVFYRVALDSCPYKKGELVELDVEQHKVPTPLFVVKGGKTDGFTTRQRNQRKKRQSKPVAVR
jgi:hypothetical protein